MSLLGHVDLCFYNLYLCNFMFESKLCLFKKKNQALHYESVTAKTPDWESVCPVTGTAVSPRALRMLGFSRKVAGAWAKRILLLIIYNKKCK